MALKMLRSWACFTYCFKDFDTGLLVSKIAMNTTETVHPKRRMTYGDPGASDA